MHALKRLQFRDKNSNWYFSAVLISLFVVSVHLHGDCRFAPVEPAALDRTRHQHHQHQHRRRRRPWHRHVLTGRILSLRVPIKQAAGRQTKTAATTHPSRPSMRAPVCRARRLCKAHPKRQGARERAVVGGLRLCSWQHAPKHARTRSRQQNSSAPIIFPSSVCMQAEREEVAGGERGGESRL
ncbi:uncharacterized protein BKA78DRAFT_95791 [Phyllosticta capitalensis]|uniref:uncharacterized protein n=1 Tax=Phyllosticta capitalensis TaxID=121624 RepID=UPI00312FDCDB